MRDKLDGPLCQRILNGHAVELTKPMLRQACILARIANKPTTDLDLAIAEIAFADNDLETFVYAFTLIFEAMDTEVTEEIPA